MAANIPRNRKEGEDAPRRPLPWRLVAKERLDSSYNFAYSVPPGYSVRDIEKQIDAFYSACGAVVEIKDRAGVVIFEVYPDDFPGAIPYSPEFLELTEGREVLLGFDRAGRPVKHNFRVPHLLLAGMSGYGKTDLLRWLLFQLISRFTPDELEIRIVDMKGFSFLPFRGIPHVQVTRDLAGALDVLTTARGIMKERSNEIWESGQRELTDSFKWHLVVIDEASQIAPNVIKSKEEKELAGQCDEAAAAISGIGREASVGLFYCTQRPDSDVINPLVKANMDAKFCFRTMTESNSEIVLDQAGAEKLPHGKPGRGLYATDQLTQVLVPYIGKDEAWEKLLEPYKGGKGFEVQTQSNFENDVRPSDSIDPTNIEVISKEWFPLQEGLGNLKGIGNSKIDRGEKQGDWSPQGVAPIPRWTFPPGDK